MQIIEEDANLRLRTEPYVATNPNTGARISIKTGEADVDFRVNGQWVPFLRFSKGDLTTKYVQEFDDQNNATRAKIAEVARRLGAVIATDAGDDLLSY